MDEMVTELIEDLTTELTITDTNFNSDLLTVKVNNAVKEVAKVRNYPSHYTSEMIRSDIQKFYSQARSISLYDYNVIGSEYEKSHSENSINRTYIDRKELFAGIIPLSRTIKK